MKRAIHLVRVLGVGGVMLCAPGCHVPGVVLSLDADSTVGPKLDSYCVSLVASGQRRFGQRYATSVDALPQTIGVKADGQKTMVARLEGYAGGLRIASDAASFDLSAKQPGLMLDACASSTAPANAMAFHARDAVTGTPIPIADHLAFARTGLEAPGAISVVLAGNHVGIAATYVNDVLQQTPTPTPTAAVDALVAIDYDADCADDVILSTSGGSEAAWSDGTSGTFSTDSAPLPAVLGAAEAIASADLNGDGFADLVGVGANSTSSFILLSNGRGGFSNETNFDTQPTGGQAAAIGDVDGDGVPDLVVGFAQLPAAWWKGDGKGNFALSGKTLPTSNGVTSIGLTDLDGNGSLDVVAAVTNGSPGLQVFLNSGTGTFSNETTAWVPATLDPSGLVVNVVDVDHDCVDEILFGGSASAAHLLGVHNGQLQDRGAIGNNPTTALGAADLDGDGLPEIVLLTIEDIEIWSQTPASSTTQSGSGS